MATVGIKGLTWAGFNPKHYYVWITRNKCVMNFMSYQQMYINILLGTVLANPTNERHQ